MNVLSLSSRKHKPHPLQQHHTPIGQHKRARHNHQFNHKVARRIRGTDQIRQRPDIVEERASRQIQRRETQCSSCVRGGEGRE